MRKPTLKNIVIFGKFSDGKIRQVLCNEEQQVTALINIRMLDPDGILHVIDSHVEGIEWISDVNINKKIKQKRF